MTQICNCYELHPKISKTYTKTDNHEYAFCIRPGIQMWRGIFLITMQKFTLRISAIENILTRRRLGVVLLWDIMYIDVFP